MAVIGIDLGTTNSVVAWTSARGVEVIPNAEGVSVTPSVVTLDQKGRPLVGTLGARMAGATPERAFSATKRLMGRSFADPIVQAMVGRVPYTIVEGPGGLAAVEGPQGLLSPVQIAAEILKHMREIAERRIGENVTQAVVTVPAYFADAQLRATKAAAEMAGLDVLALLEEPTAAALAYGIGKRGTRNVAVYDLGGGTFDISIIEVGDGVARVLAVAGDNFLGGEDFDARIVDLIAERFLARHGVDLRASPLRKHRLRDEVERAKRALSQVDDTTLTTPGIAIDMDTGQPLDLMDELARQTIEELCRDLVQASLSPCRRALEDAQLSRDDIDAVVLVGGMTRMPMVEEAVAEFFGRTPEHGVHPDEAVAIGAALHASVLAGAEYEPVLFTVTPFSLGVETAGGSFERVIRRNTAVPVRRRQVFTTARDKQTGVTVKVFQGEDPIAARNQLLGRFSLDGIAPRAAGESEIEVIYEIDADRIITVTARDLGTNKTKSLKVTRLGEEQPAPPAQPEPLGPRPFRLKVEKGGR